MAKEYSYEFNNNYISAEEPYKNDNGAVVFGKINDDGMLNCLYSSEKPKDIIFFIDLIKHLSKLQQENEQFKKDLEWYKHFYHEAVKDNQKLYENNLSLRHEICEKIRNTAGKYWTRLEDDNENLVDYYITPKDLDNIIDEIEGEK